MTMNREDICEAIEALKIPWNSEASLTEIYSLMEARVKALKAPVSACDWKLDNGCLYDGSVFLGRVAPLKRPAYVSNEVEADFWENKILARQEAWMD